MPMPLRPSCVLRCRSRPMSAVSAGVGCKVAAMRPPVTTRLTLLAMAILPGGRGRRWKLSIKWSASLR